MTCQGGDRSRDSYVLHDSRLSGSERRTRVASTRGSSHALVPGSASATIGTSVNRDERPRDRRAPGRHCGLPGVGAVGPALKRGSAGGLCPGCLPDVRSSAAKPWLAKLHGRCDQCCCPQRAAWGHMAPGRQRGGGERGAAGGAEAGGNQRRGACGRCVLPLPVRSLACL